MTEHTEKDVYAFLTNRFQPIYADLVASLGEKPTQIVLQLESAFVHLGTAHKYPEKYQDNVNKSYGHLQRATLDAAKILWHSNKVKLERFIADEELRKFSINSSESGFFKSYREAESLARQARNLEIQFVGVDPERSLVAYHEAALKLSEVLDLVDPDKLQSFKRFRVLFDLRKQALGLIIGFFIGMLSGISANIIYDRFFH